MSRLRLLPLLFLACAPLVAPGCVGSEGEVDDEVLEDESAIRSLAPTAVLGAIAYGETKNGSLRTKAYRAYSFEGAAGDDVRAEIDASAARIESIRIVDASFRDVAVVSGPSQKTLSVAAKLTKAGRHYVVFRQTTTAAVTHAVSLAGGAATPAPANLRFADDDLSAGSVSGTVTVSPAPDETQVASYKLFWGSSATTRLGEIASLAKGAPLRHALSGGQIPAGASHLLAVAVSASGAESPPVATPLVDDAASAATITAPVDGLFSVGDPSAVIDAASQKLLVATSPGVFRCELDGTACTFTSFSSPVGYASITVEPVTRAIYVGAAPWSFGAARGTPVLFRCELDMSGCTKARAGSATADVEGAAWNGRVAIDASAKKVVFAARDMWTQAFPRVFRCELDLTGCTTERLFPTGSGVTANAISPGVFDPASGKTLFGFGMGNDWSAGVLVCGGAGSCDYRTAGWNAGRLRSSGQRATLALDGEAGKLFVASQDGANDHRLGLLRCRTDGTGCVALEGTPGARARSGASPSAVVDAANGRVLVAVTNDDDGSRLGLVRCDADGTACSYLDASAGLAAGSGVAPVALLDRANGKLRVVARSGAATFSVVSVPLR